MSKTTDFLESSASAASKSSGSLALAFPFLPLFGAGAGEVGFCAGGDDACVLDFFFRFFADCATSKPFDLTTARSVLLKLWPPFPRLLKSCRCLLALQAGFNKISLECL